MKAYILVDKNQRHDNGFVKIFTYLSACQNHKINRELWFKKNQKKIVKLEIVSCDIENITKLNK